MQERRAWQIDKQSSDHLGLLAEREQRTKIDELRFLIKRRAQELEISLD